MVNLHVEGPARLPLHWGNRVTPFTLLHFTVEQAQPERWIAAYTGPLDSATPVPLRIESACVFGHIMRSRQCDCGYQLEAAMRHMAESGRGLLIYGLDQDARGLGTAAHFAIYRMRQQEGLDTAEVFQRLEAAWDSRSYEPVVAILRHLGVNAVSLLTNNEERARYLRDNGIKVRRQPLEAPLDVHNMSTLMLEKEDLGYRWSFETHADWLEPMQREVDGIDRSQGRMAVPGRGRAHDNGVTAAGDPWDLCDQLVSQASAARLGKPLVVYLTDLPPLHDLARYRATGVDVVVVPFAKLPRVLTLAGERCGLKVVDWARRNAYRHARPQWTLVGYTASVHAYRRGDRVRHWRLDQPGWAEYPATGPGAVLDLRPVTDETAAQVVDSLLPGPVPT